jgi:oligosaccharide repeat unit polymerase
MSSPQSDFRGAFIIRLVMYLAIIGACFSGIEGQVAHTMSVVCMLIDVALYLVWRPSSLPVILCWKLAYVALICREGLVDADLAIARSGRSSYDVASQFVTAANAAVLLGHMFVSSLGANRIYQRFPIHRVDVRRWGVLTVALLVAYLIKEIPAAETVFFGGRAASSQDIELSARAALTSGFVLSLAVGMPSILAYYLVWLRGVRPSMALFVVAPIVVLQMVVGTRFVMLMSLAGVVAVIMSKERISQRLLAVGTAVLGFLLVASAITAAARYEGFANSTLTQYFEYLEANGFVHSEGMIINLSALVSHFERVPHLHGASNLGILLFWIPRAFWPDKPTLLGYWFIRLATARGFSKGHSIGLTFAADSYADFGYVGGLLFCVVIGIVMGAVERLVAKLLARPGVPYIVAVAPLYGAAVFAIRSLDTAFIVTTGFTSLGLLTSIFCQRRVPAEQTAPVLAQAR